MMELQSLAGATLAVAAGAVVQAVSGVGAGFIIVPLVALVDVGLIPGPLIFASMSLSCAMSWAERRHIDLARLPVICLGLIPGSACGAWVLSGVPADRLGIVFGILVLCGVAITASGIRIPVTRVSAFIAGLVAGAMGTAAGFGAPPLALMYQDETGPRVRATLGLLYTLSSLIILAILWLFGKLHRQEMLAGALLMPGYLGGWLAARHLTVHFEGARSRLIILGVSAAAAVSLLVRSL